MAGVFAAPRPVEPQSSYQRSGNVARLQAPSSIVWVAAAGLGKLVADLEDPLSGNGPAIRVGIRSHYYGAWSSIERWMNVSGFTITSALLEGTLNLASNQGFRPHLIVGVGRTWSSYSGPATRADGPNGSTGVMGLGTTWSAPWSIEALAQALIRTDDTGFNASTRLLVGWSPNRERLRVGPTESEVSATIAWMTPVAGPWRFVEPAYGLRVTKREGPVGPFLDLSVYHWQIPGQAFFRDYVWDTRAFVARPGIAWHLPRTPTNLTLRLGPSIVIMGEGPGNGVNIGTHVEASVSPRWAGPLGAGIGWLWMGHDSYGDSRITDTDQHGLLLFVTLGG